MGELVKPESDTLPEADALPDRFSGPADLQGVEAVAVRVAHGKAVRHEMLLEAFLVGVGDMVGVGVT